MRRRGPGVVTAILVALALGTGTVLFSMSLACDAWHVRNERQQRERFGVEKWRFRQRAPVPVPAAPI